jgi:hypothetical protein
LLYGGSRSGKTTVLVMAVIYRALRFAGSRHLICRYRAKDSRSSVLRSHTHTARRTHPLPGLEPLEPGTGVNPLLSLSLELEQDYYANKANSNY